MRIPNPPEPCEGLKQTPIGMARPSFRTMQKKGKRFRKQKGWHLHPEDMGDNDCIAFWKVGWRRGYWLGRHGEQNKLPAELRTIFQHIPKLRLAYWRGYDKGLKDGEKALNVKIARLMKKKVTEGRGVSLASVKRLRKQIDPSMKYLADSGFSFDEVKKNGRAKSR